MKLLYHASLAEGSTSLQRVRAFEALPGVTVIGHDTGARMSSTKALWKRIRWKLGWPADDMDENIRLRETVARERPDVVAIDNSKVVSRPTLRALRELGVTTLAYYTPDDVMGSHNLSWPLRLSFPEWDVFFTTKTFNVPELKAAGVRNPVLVGKAYDPQLHTPMSRDEVGPDYERFDLAFAGACERERMASINALGEAGLETVVYGGALGGWDARTLHPAVTLRDAVFGRGYVQALHQGKIALCFLRKVNRDRITQRTMEIAACGRPMLGEKTDEHDQHFVDGAEYMGFLNDAELVAKAQTLLRDPHLRQSIAGKGRERCLASGYSTLDRALQMLNAMQQASSRANVNADAAAKWRLS